MDKIFKKIKLNNYDALDLWVFSEHDLAILAGLIRKDKGKPGIVQDLILKIPEHSRNYDWNVGSIIQHLDVELVIDVLRSDKNDRLLNSIGLAFALGEFKNTNRVIIDFLYRVIERATNSDAWWRAAFSLEGMGNDEAVNLLKMSLKGAHLRGLDYCLDNIDDKKSVISLLILSNVENIEQVIYPRIKEIFLKTDDDQVTISCCWLIGRLKLIDNDIYSKLITLVSHSNYELKYYTFFALQNNAAESLKPVLIEALKDTDPLIRKMAARSLMSMGNEQLLTLLNKALYEEKEESVIAELSRAIYHLQNPINKARLLLEIHSNKNENGMISDESDKWYKDPAIYLIFSEAEDPENLCFSLIQERVGDLAIINPIDLATGTGRIIWQITDRMKFSGTLFALDASEQMCNFLNKTIKRERRFTNNIKVVNATIADAPKNINLPSTFIISSFGFPSRISDQEVCLSELKSVYEMLADDGLFFTIGWDETFNDELNKMWFKFIPDKIEANSFEEWRKKRSSSISSSRNLGLSWFKKGIFAPLQFTSVRESAFVMGYLFGRDAAKHVINTSKTEWGMSLGITCNTKKELGNIIKSYEGN